MLSQIAAKKRERVEAAKFLLPVTELKEKMSGAPAPRPFQKALELPGISVIAEIKKASPSKGDFSVKLGVEELASQYERGGARAVSVLTEEDFFLGQTVDLSAVRATVTLPVLRKDFIIDPYQVYESRLLGADAILLIAGLLGTAELQEYLAICNELGMSALVEAHSQAELELALQAGARIVGINNRDLQTFRTDVSRTLALAGMVPDEVILVSESGIQNAADVRKLLEVGVDSILVGEALVRSDNPAAKIRELTGGAGQ